MIRKMTFVVLLLVFLLAGFYRWFEYHSDQIAEQNNLVGRSANAIKHADAARAVYNGLRRLQISPSWAAKIVKNLGYWNEIAELVVKQEKDETLEMAKDMHNNVVGIVVAQWCENNQCNEPSAAMLVKLARSKVLAIEPEDLSFSKQEKDEASLSPNVRWADEWLYKNQQNIQSRVNQYLDKP